MTAGAVPVRGALWAQPDDVREQTLPFWRALLIALGVEIIVPFLVYGVDWSFLPNWKEPPPTQVMSVRLEQPPPQLVPPRPQPEKKKQPKPEEPKKLKDTRQVAVEPPKPLPNEEPSNIALPKPEPKPKPKPKEKEQPELPPLPSVFRDVKPVKKVKPKYPREAEDKKIEGHVKVRLKVELDGTVSDVKLLESDPPGVFEDAVFEAVRQYIFKKDGTRYYADQEVIFKIDP